ncbi:hypothetical protein [Roseiflexus castenholzii]|uniref:hypothetical protein n=1 Tax=Roseiflexus castenholzii TaxID=120962 RepID=UPI002352BC48
MRENEDETWVSQPTVASTTTNKTGIVITAACTIGGSADNGGSDADASLWCSNAQVNNGA